MKIDGYKVEKLIGKGGMAMVYLAIQESLMRPVALKVMNPIYSDSPEFSQRFLDEGRLLAAVRHPNILTIHDIGISNGYHFISMEYVEGGDLRDRLREGITPEQATDYVETIAGCLSVAHDTYIVHRDIKPANILFRKDGTLLLGDFGIAKQLTADRDLTISGSLVGSPSYLSPEQALGKAVDGRSDIYSLGVLYYEMLSGEKPYKGDSDVDVAIKHIDDELPKLPDELSAYWGIMERMMRKEPGDRFPSCMSLLYALRELKQTGQWSGVIADIPLPEIQETFVSIELTMEGPEPTLVGMPPGMEPDAVHRKKVFRKALASGKDYLVSVYTVAAGKLVWVYEVLKQQLSRVGSSSKGVHDSTTVERPAVSPSGVSGLKQQIMKHWTIGAAISAGLAVIVVIALLPGQQSEPVIGKDKRVEQGETITSALSLSTTKSKLRPPSRHAKITRLLQRAENALEKDHLTTPHKVSAYAYYQQVLILDQNNKSANRGLDNIAYRYYRLAKKVAGNGEHDKAKQFVVTGLRVRPQHQLLLQYQKELNSVENLVVRKSKEGLGGLFRWLEKTLLE